MRVGTMPIAAALLIVVGGLAAVPADEGKPVRVTVDNFRRAESDTYFARFVKEGGFGKFKHERGLAEIDRQTVIRLNRDTLYSFGVFDLDAAPVTVTLPDAGKRFMAVQVIDEDHYAPNVFYAPGAHTLTKEKIGTRYVCLAIRTFVNPNGAADVKAVHALQDAIKVEQKAAGKFEVPDGKFIKVTANGDQIFGQLSPASATAGSMSFTGGTGKFANASGSASYVISVSPRTGATNIDVDGTLSFGKGDARGPKEAGKAQAFAITGQGPAPEGLPLAPHVLAPHGSAGTASFLGSFTGTGFFEQENLSIDPSTGAVTANFQGTFTFVAANGDKLVVSYGTGYTGQLTGQMSADGSAVLNVEFDAIFTIDGALSTGQFAGASGSWRMIAHADSVSLISMVPGYTAPFDYTWTGGGTIVLAHGKS